MTKERQAELLRAEALRRRSIAMVDEPRKKEHLEVAEALELAADRAIRRTLGHKVFGISFERTMK